MIRNCVNIFYILVLQVYWHLAESRITLGDVGVVVISINSEVDLGFLERGFVCIKVWEFALLIINIP